MVKKEYYNKVLDCISMRDVITMYSYRTDREKGRIPCPIHNGKHKNFSYNDKVFNCFVCGAKGNAITFVAQLFNISNQEALIKIDHDFNLRVVGTRITAEEKAKIIQRTIEIKKQEAEKKEKENYYYETVEFLHSLQRAIKKVKPLNKDGSWNELYVWFLNTISEYEYRADKLLEEVNL